MSYTETFKRWEKKYILDSVQYKYLIRRLEEYTVPDKYGKSAICSIYFDTPDKRLIRASLEKPVYKEKLRLRSYGVPNRNTDVFLEIKKKFKGIVYKRRECMKYFQAENYLYKGENKPLESQIMNEIDYFKHFYPDLEASMYISYDRTALYSKEDESLRITIDNRILWRDADLQLIKGVYGRPVLKPGEYLMEIKIPLSMPLWLSQILDEAEIFPISFSKYGTAYLQSIDNKKEGKVIYA